MSSTPLPLSIHPISGPQTAPLRHLVLWPSIDLENQLDPAYDFDEHTIHLGAYLTSTIPGVELEKQYLPGGGGEEDAPAQEAIGILTLAVQPYSTSATLPPPLSHPIPSSTTQVQLHKFATHPALRGLGIGRLMLARALELLKEKYGAGNVLFHLDARANQKVFYTRCGMQVLDEREFEKRGTTGKGPAVIHIRMGALI
ncbi:hypothetical protein IAT38_001075 [Cryptococcus sp. DSM 104549]